jgi:gliding motility-associated-like protein
VYNGQTYTSSGSFTQILVNSQGCDSAATLIITIKSSSSYSVSQTACNSYTLNGQTYNSSGTYNQLYTNAVGCDSTLLLNLVIHLDEYTFENKSDCNFVTWNGQVYTSSGTYSQSYIASTGCDSIATLIATIFTNTASSITLSGCTSVSVNGQNYTSSGTYTQHLTNANGCDSSILLYVTIELNSATEQYLHVCKGNSITIGQHTYTTTGDFIDTLQNSSGCDSIITTHLEVENSQEGGYFIANAFSPNNDGLNDCFGITYWKNVEKLQFIICNRWGEVVFNTTQIWDCWNGHYKGAPSEQGTYYYYIKATFSCGEQVYKGDLTLIR